MLFPQVLTSLEPLDYLFVAFLPGITEVNHTTIFHYMIVCRIFAQCNTQSLCVFSRNSSFVVHCNHFLETTGRVYWLWLVSLVFYIWAAAESIPLQSGNISTVISETDHEFGGYSVQSGVICYFQGNICRVGLWLCNNLVKQHHCPNGFSWTEQPCWRNAVEVQQPSKSLK